MPELMRIGQFARLCGISMRALRLYDEAGVLTPAATSVTTGYRYYSADQLSIARRIGELRQMNLPLVEIRALLVAPEPQQARMRLAIHRAHLERQLHATRQALDRLQSLDRWYASQTEEETVSAMETIYTCSFCSKQNSEVERMIAGPNGVFICNECVALCNQIIDTEHDGATQESGDGMRQDAATDHR